MLVQKNVTYIKLTYKVSNVMVRYLLTKTVQNINI